jgi:hypothetical protein
MRDMTVTGSTLVTAVNNLKNLVPSSSSLVSMLLSTNSLVTVDGPYLIGIGGGSVWRNGWKSHDTLAGARQPRFWKVGGYCYFDGIVSAGSGASVVGSVVFNLPIAYRPNAGAVSEGYNRHFIVTSALPTSQPTTGQIHVDSQTGDFVFYQGEPGWISIDQINYKCS